MYEITEAGIKLIPIENTNAPINPLTVFYNDLILYGNSIGSLIIEIEAF
jgi:hypothetical protein